MLPSRLKKLSDGLRKARMDWQAMDSERGAAVAALRGIGAEFERLDAPWVRRLQEHDEPALEDASEQLGAQLELRRSVLEDQLSGVDRHRTVLVDELLAVADDGMKLLRQASNLSKLLDNLPGIRGAHFLRIQTQEPDDPSEKRARLAELIDELLDGKHDLGGVALVQAAVRRLARPVQEDARVARDHVPVRIISAHDRATRLSARRAPARLGGGWRRRSHVDFRERRALRRCATRPW